MTPRRDSEPRSGGFSADEQRRIAHDVREGSEPTCPRCGASLDEWPVEPRPDVSYVRSRLWLVCTSCRRSVVLDRPRPGQG